jgi:hypothetical protein
MGRDWHQWHQAYEDPGSHLSERLATVQAQIRAALDAASAGPLTVVSMVSGQGRDLIGVLANHPRAGDVRARLVELDPALAQQAREAAASHGLDGVDVLTGDAADPANYSGYHPADLVLICGLFGNISDDDIRRTTVATAGFAALGARVIWTRHRRDPDLFPTIQSWFAEAGLDTVYASEPGERFGVGVQVQMRTPGEVPSGPLFAFADQA